MPFRNDDTGSVTRLCGSNDCTEIMRIFHAVQYNDQRSVRLEENLEIGIGCSARNGNDPLMDAACGHTVQNGPVFLAYRHGTFARKV